MNPHEQVYIPKLLVLGGLAYDLAAGISAIVHGRVYIERWNIGVAEVNLPRWVLRGVTITSGDRSMRISDDGRCITRQPTGPLELV